MHTEMDVQHLPLDVLFSIMAASPCDTISAMMRTCRTLYSTPESLRLFLWDVTLASSNQIISFLPFMLAAPATRFDHLLALTFKKGCFSDAAVDAIRALLAHPSLIIETLILHDAEAVLTSGTPPQVSGFWRISLTVVPLLEPFARVTTLKHLTMDEAGDCASAFLRMLLASLVSVSLSFPSDPMISSYSPMWSFYDYDATTFLNPIWSLDRSTESLKVLEGSGFSLPRADPPYCDVVYPHVWKVRASFRYGTWERMVVVYAHAFPNLKHLVLNKYTGMRRYVYNPRLIQPGGWAEALRQGNREDQLKCGSWKSLCVVEGTLKAVYSLGLVCKVSELHLKDAIAESMVPCLEAVLQDVEPETLSLTIWGATMFDEHGHLSELLATSTVQCITSLTTMIHFVGSEGDSGIEDILDNIMFRLSNLPLRRLELILKQPPIKPSDRENHRLAEQYFNEFDFQAYISRFKATIPTLENISVKHCTS
ncbi:hypothetical protein ONZ51_g7874 [Trametes cubensis]|uniref:Uncharacterized protein n=1 Tax=Trametes cubensis TaxID=1111947 RepID=A0AAD7TRW7_9APHY|nr:hypothetical protein ONZ51_g7874 [Trametes cubensis]